MASPDLTAKITRSTSEARSEVNSFEMRKVYLDEYVGCSPVSNVQAISIITVGSIAPLLASHFDGVSFLNDAVDYVANAGVFQSRLSSAEFFI